MGWKQFIVAKIGSIVEDTIRARARARFASWPPAAHEITPGIGGGVTGGVDAALLTSLGTLWMAVPQHRADMTPAAAADVAACYVGTVYGWGTITAAQLEPDQFYVVRNYLRTWVETGQQPVVR